MKSIRHVPRALLVATLLSLASYTDASAEPVPCAVDSEGRYQVRNGEHLRLIAHRCFGNGRFWIRIAELNRISSPNLIRAGEMLRLPTDLKQVASETSRKVEVQYCQQLLENDPEFASRFRINSASDSLAGDGVSKSEISASRELQVLKSEEAAKSPEQALQKTQEFLKSNPDQISARLSEIRLLVKKGDMKQAQLKSQALLSDHPELSSIKKLKEWASTPEQE